MKSKWTLEVVFWLFSFVIVALLLLPIYFNVGNRYPFYILNTICILITFHAMRTVLFMKFSLFGRINWIKVVLFFLCIPVFVYLTDALYEVQSFRDNIGITKIVEHLPYEKQKWLSSYIIKITMGGIIAAFVASIILPIRLLKSVWRTKNIDSV